MQQPDYDGIVPMRGGIGMAADMCFPRGYDFPEGFYMNIADAITRGRFRDSFESPRLMKPGGQDQFTVVLCPTSDVFAEGQGLRADISRSYFQRMDVNPNTGEPLRVSRRKVVADNAVYHDGELPSHIILQVMQN